MSKPNLLLLHGALGSKSQFMPLLPYLEEKFALHTLDFEGHGASPPGSRPFRIEYFAENAMDYLEQNSLPEVDLFGYSMGGYVGLYLALHHPERLKRIFTLATKFDWTPAFAAAQAEFLNAEKLLHTHEKYAKALQKIHAAAGWETVLQKTGEMMQALGEKPLLSGANLPQLARKVRIGVGDKDHMVSLEESIDVFRLLPHSELQIFPGTPHPFEKAPHAFLAASLIDFFK